MDFTIADGVILGIVGLSAVLAYARGLTREALAILGWVLAAIAAVTLAPLVEPLLMEVPGLGGLLASSCTLSRLAAFSVAFAIALLVLSIFTPLLSSAVQNSMIAPLDRALGFVFGAARGVALVAVAWLVYDQIVPAADRIAAIDQSRSVQMIAEAAALIEAALPSEAPAWAMGPIEGFMADCATPPAGASRAAAAG